MFDPAALGTLLIGLDANRAAESAPTRSRRGRPARRTGWTVRVAAALRRVADRLDAGPRPVVADAPC